MKAKKARGAAFPFTRRQLKWLAALESGQFQQGQGVLWQRAGRKMRYCCLGVASKVCRLGERNEAVLEATYPKMGLRSPCGDSAAAGEPALTNLNDQGLTFKKIAAELRQHPERYFTNLVQEDKL